MTARGISGLILVEPALPTPFAIVTARSAGREEAQFFNTIADARQFGRSLAEERGALLIDMTSDIDLIEGGEE